jgi:hypothetical protein
MLNAQFRPLDQWPGERTPERRSAPFRATYPQTLDLLEYELRHLGARDVIIQVEGLSRDDIRNDGWPRGQWKCLQNRPGVIVSFESPKGAISMPCDKFQDWQDNLRAIAKSLEALRMVDRYGVTRGNEQYRGWAKLEAPGAKNGKMDRDAAFRFLAGLHKSPPENLSRLSSDQLRDICRTARIENHPDRGGSHETFVNIGEAERVLCS